MKRVFGIAIAMLMLGCSDDPRRPAGPDEAPGGSGGGAGGTGGSGGGEPSRDTMPPEIVIESPAHGVPVDGPVVMVRGVVRDDRAVTEIRYRLNVDNEVTLPITRAAEVPLDLPIELVAGDNLLHLVARDAAGNEAQRQLIVSTRVVTDLPEILSFAADPAIVPSVGATTTLRWELAGGKAQSVSVLVLPGGASTNVTNRTSLEVAVESPQTFVLTATNAVGSANAQVTVSPRLPTPRIEPRDAVVYEGGRSYFRVANAPGWAFENTYEWSGSDSRRSVVLLGVPLGPGEARISVTDVYGESDAVTVQVLPLPPPSHEFVVVPHGDDPFSTQQVECAGAHAWALGHSAELLHLHGTEVERIAIPQATASAHLAVPPDGGSDVWIALDGRLFRYRAGDADLTLVETFAGHVGALAVDETGQPVVALGGVVRRFDGNVWQELGNESAAVIQLAVGGDTVMALRDDSALRIRRVDGSWYTASHPHGGPAVVNTSAPLFMDVAWDGSAWWIASRLGTFSLEPNSGAWGTEIFGEVPRELAVRGDGTLFGRFDRYVYERVGRSWKQFATIDDGATVTIPLGLAACDDSLLAATRYASGPLVTRPIE